MREAQPGITRALDMFKNKRPFSLDTIKLSNPQRVAVGKLLAMQKNKYKKLLHEAHERMHIIADISTNVEFWYNVNGVFEYVSPSCETVLGYAPEAFLNEGLRLETIVAPDEKERFRKDKSRALTGESGADVEYPFIAMDGATHWMLMTWNPVATRRGKHIGVRISLRDITEYKQCLHFSRAYEQLMLTIADELESVAIFSVTSEGAVKTWNRTAAALFGYDNSEILGLDFIMLFSTVVDLEKELPDFTTFSCDTKLERKMTFRKKDGTDFVGRITFCALCDHTGTLHQVTCLLPKSAGG
jgi:PAS domain S-box-containing protein